MTKEMHSLVIDNKILATLMKNTDKVFGVDGVLITKEDFRRVSSQCIYAAIVSLATKCKRIDPVVLDNRIAKLSPQEYRKHGDYFIKRLKKLAKLTPASNLGEYVNIVVGKATRECALDHLAQMKFDISTMNEGNDIVNHLTDRTAEFANSQMRAPDVVYIPERFPSFMKHAEEIMKQDGKIGISSGHKYYDRAIGGGHRRKAVDVIVARAKTGKSLHAWNEAYHVSKEVPVLVLDTELDETIQMARLLSIISGLSIKSIETGKFLNKKKLRKKIQKAQKILSGMKLYYQPIKGWHVDKQVSFVRSWFARYVGRDNKGKMNDALVILDYLKIMDVKGMKSIREFEALGNQLSKLHDLMDELDAPMLCMAQQNRLGLEEQHEGTVAGSDRISWYCDSLAFLRPRRYADLAEDYEEKDWEEKGDHPFNMTMKVQLSRFGDGNPGNEFIAMYADIHNPKMKKHQKCARIEEWNLDYAKPKK